MSLALGLTYPAQASPWAQSKGEGLAIVKYEAMRADKAYDPYGEPVELNVTRKDRSLSLYAEYGLTDRVTVQLKSDWQAGEDEYADYSGRGPIEVGLRWQAYQGKHTVAAIYGGYAKGGSGRNAGYAAPGEGDEDYEVRLMLGHSRKLMFSDVQLARRWRQGLVDEVRLDTTVGLNFSANWMVMVQTFGGWTDSPNLGERTQWLNLEASLVRHQGPWSAQLAWRTSLSGQETPAAHGPAVAIWRRF